MAETLRPSKQLVEMLDKQREASREIYEKLNTQAFHELTTSANRLNEVAKKFAAQYEPVIKAVDEMKKQLSGVILSSNRLYGIESSLFEVARRLNESGLGEAIKRFEDSQRRIKNIYGNYTFSPAYEKLEGEEKKLEKKAQVEPWGAWENMPITRRLVYEPELVIEEAKQEVAEDPTKEWTLLNLYGVAGEMEQIRSGKVSDNDVVFFKVKDFRGNAQRLHNFLMAELTKALDTDARLDFDAEHSILYFAGRQIVISARAQSDPHDLLRTIFKDKHREWHNDEILDDWKVGIAVKPPKNKVYQAGKKVNDIVAKQTQITDFLDVTTKKISINKRFLGK